MSWLAISSLFVLDRRSFLLSRRPFGWFRHRWQQYAACCVRGHNQVLILAYLLLWYARIAWCINNGVARPHSKVPNDFVSSKLAVTRDWHRSETQIGTDIFKNMRCRTYSYALCEQTLSRCLFWWCGSSWAILDNYYVYCSVLVYRFTKVQFLAIGIEQ